MPKYAHIHSCIAEDRKINALARESLLAALLWDWAIARADVYGILPGWPDLFMAKVCPALGVSIEQVAEVIELLVKYAFVERYEADGEQYLYVRHYHRYNEVRWCRIQPPQSPLPPDWQVPDDLRDQLQRTYKGDDLRRMQAVCEALAPYIGSIAREHSEQVPDTFREHSGNVPGTFPASFPRSDVQTSKKRLTPNDVQLDSGKAVPLESGVDVTFLSALKSTDDDPFASVDGTEAPEANGALLEQPDDADAEDCNNGKRRIRGPTLTGMMARIRDHLKHHRWPLAEMNSFLYELRAVLATQEARDRLVSSSTDEAAEYVLGALQDNPGIINTAKLASRPMRAWQIGDLMDAAHKLAVWSVDNEEAYNARRTERGYPAISGS